MYIGPVDQLSAFKRELKSYLLLSTSVISHPMPATQIIFFGICCFTVLGLQCFDTVGWAAGRASGL